LRLDALAEVRVACNSPAHCPCAYLEVARHAMHSCLNELRQIASGLHLPEIGDLSLADTARRAVRDFERKSGTKVHLDVDIASTEAPLAVTITVYRLVQEALANGWRHAKGSPQQVRLSLSDGAALIEVRDQGPGFDGKSASLAGGLGLAFLSERVRLLGGIFEVDTAPGRGTRVLGRLPLSAVEPVHG
jgi:signal transduction histidine kinase